MGTKIGKPPQPVVVPKPAAAPKPVTAPVTAAPAAPAPKWAPTGNSGKHAAVAHAPLPAESRSQAAADASALHRALNPGMSGLGTDEKAVFATLAHRSTKHLDDVKRLYAEHFHQPLEQALAADLSGHQLARAKALLAGDPTQATVEALKYAIRSGDHDGLISTLKGSDVRYPSLEADVKAGVLGPTKDVALALVQGNRPKADAAQLDAAMNLMLDPARALEVLGSTPDRAALAKEYEARTHRPLSGDVDQRLRGTDKDQAVALLKGDALGVNTARLKQAVDGKFFGLGKDATAALAIIEGAPKDQKAKLAERYQQAYGSSLAGDVAAKFGGRDGERLTHALEGKLDDVDRIQIALKGYGADKAAIQAVLSGRTPEETATLKKDFLAKTGGSLESALSKELSGRALFDAGLALEGIPQTAEQAVSQAERRRDFERGGGANAISRTVMDLVSNDGARMDQAVTDARKAIGGDADRVAELAALAAGDVKQYRAAKESVGQGVAMGAALAATAATGGLGAGLVVGVAAGATASVAANAAIAGKGYQHEDIARDAVKGGLGAMSVGGTAKIATSVLGRAGEAGARAAASGFVSAAADTALQAETWNGGLASGAVKTGVAGATSAAVGAAMGAAQSLGTQVVVGNRNNVVATKLPSGEVDLSTYEADKATRAALKKAVPAANYKAEQSMSKFYKQNEAKVLKDIALEDVMGLRMYTGADYTAMNTALRTGKDLAAQEAKIKTASSALKNMPAFKGTVYRQAELSPAIIAKYEVGETIAEKAFMSTTSNKASKFAGNTEFVIKSKGGGKMVDMISNYQAEAEVLFPPGTEFKVLKKAVVAGKQTIFLQEVQ